MGPRTRVGGCTIEAPLINNPFPEGSDRFAGWFLRCCKVEGQGLGICGGLFLVAYYSSLFGHWRVDVLGCRMVIRALDFVSHGYTTRIFFAVGEFANVSFTPVQHSGLTYAEVSALESLCFWIQNLGVRASRLINLAALEAMQPSRCKVRAGVQREPAHFSNQHGAMTRADACCGWACGSNDQFGCNVLVALVS